MRTVAFNVDRNYFGTNKTFHDITSFMKFISLLIKSFIRSNEIFHYILSVVAWALFIIDFCRVKYTASVDFVLKVSKVSAMRHKYIEHSRGCITVANSF